MKKYSRLIKGIFLTAFLAPGLIMYVKSSGKLNKGNDRQYDTAHTDRLDGDSLEGKTIIFLGSSVTYGSASGGESFVEYLQVRDGIIPVKEALSGTTLVDEDVRGRQSYVRRMKNIDRNIKADCFVCQLSTNDASLKKDLGTVSDSFEKKDFDVLTVAGAIEYIIAYARETWNCPVMFYTGTRYKSNEYGKMVELLKQIQQKWNIEVLDLWNDEEMNQVDKKDYAVYMANGIHPTKAGYREWWTPKFEEKLKEIFQKER